MSIRKFNVNKTESEIALASAMFPGFMSKEDKIALDALVASNFTGGSITSVTVTMTDITEVKDRLSMLDVSVNSIEDKDRTQDSSISSLSTSITNYNSTLSDLDASIKAIISVNESQSGSIETLTTNYNTLKDKVDNHDSSISGLDASIKSIISVNESQTGSIGTLTTNYNTLKGRVDTLENSLSTLSNTVNSLKTKLDEYPTLTASMKTDGQGYLLVNNVFEPVFPANCSPLYEEGATATSIALASLETGKLEITEDTDPEMIEEVRELLGDELFNELATKNAATLELHPEISDKEKVEQAKREYLERKEIEKSYPEYLDFSEVSDNDVIKRRDENI